MKSALRLSLVLFAVAALIGCQPAAEESETAAEQEQEKVPPREKEAKYPPIELAEYSMTDCPVDESPSDFLPGSPQPTPGQPQSAQAESDRQKIPGALIRRHPYLLVTASRNPEVQNLLNHWPTARSYWDNDLDDYYRTYNALMSILKVLDSVDRGCTAAHLLSAHFLTEVLAWQVHYDQEPADWDQKQEELKPFDVFLVKGTLSAEWLESSHLHQRAANEYTDTKWGEFAFAEMFAPESKDGCPWPGGSSIGTVQSFLEKRPESQYRHGLTLYLTQKYEAHWSFSHATSNPEDYRNGHGFTLNAASYTEGSGKARAGAIEWYEEYLELSSPDEDTTAITETLQKLKAGIDTELWKKVCVRD